MGKVTLIGAGPYDKDLITIKGLEALKNAEVVLYDKLVSDGIINLIPEAAERIDVGKHAGNHPIPQHEINQILLNKAVEGFNVVRLKGGDPYLFGRGGEELELLVENDIPFEVIPGITSAISAPAFAGIPVTHRNFSSSVHMITGHFKDGGEDEIDFATLAKLKGTLVFMMSVSNLNKICDGLREAGMGETTPAAIIENGTSDCQRKFVSTIEKLPEVAKANHVVSPSVIVVGKVCELSEKYDWFSKRPLHGQTVVVTRARDKQGTISKKLRDLGCNVIEFPCIKTVPVETPALIKALNAIDEYGWLIFTSPVGVNVFFNQMAKEKFDIRRLAHLKIGAVGPETEKEINSRGILTDYVPATYNGENLAKGLLERIGNEKILIVRAEEGSGELTEILAGKTYEEVPIYSTVYEKEKGIHIVDLLEKGAVDFVAFTSTSTVRGFINATGLTECPHIKALCIGEKTASEAKKYGFQLFISDRACIEGMVEKILELKDYGE